MKKYEIKDEDNLKDFVSGVKRSDDSGKPDFGLIWPEAMPYEEQMLTRFANHMTKAVAAKGARNWEQAGTLEDSERFRQAAWRHFLQYMSGDKSEDHVAALLFNLMGREYVAWRIADGIREQEA